jgi:hypothetical protein
MFHAVYSHTILVLAHFYNEKLQKKCVCYLYVRLSACKKWRNGERIFMNVERPICRQVSVCLQQEHNVKDMTFCMYLERNSIDICQLNCAEVV